MFDIGGKRSYFLKGGRILPFRWQEFYRRLNWAVKKLVPNFSRKNFRD
jgi:hypothetical protein